MQRCEIGGIYALDQIGRDSEDLHWPIVEVLAAFIREHAIRRCCRGPEEVVGVVAPSGRPHRSAASCSRPTVEDLGHRLENKSLTTSSRAAPRRHPELVTSSRYSGGDTPVVAPVLRP